MATKFNGQPQDNSQGSHRPKYSQGGRGSITNIIGTGSNAKHSIATIVLVVCFAIGFIVSIFVIVNYWCFRDCENKVPDITGDLKVIWEIVTPVITLVLGYEFGKYEK